MSPGKPLTDGFVDAVGNSFPNVLARVKSRDGAAWERLVDHYGPLVYHWCRSFELPPVEACDALREVFRSVITWIDAFHSADDQRGLCGWLWSITLDEVRLRRGSQIRGFSAESECRAALEPVKSLVHEQHPLLPGNEVAARLDSTALMQLRQYQLVQKLGQGGMGTIYKGVHTHLEKAVAIKVLPIDRVGDEEALTRFYREMVAVGRLDHPNIVRASDAGEIGGTHFLVMEYIEGIDLSRLVDRLGPLPIADACEIARQTAEGLQHVHENGLVHRDIKPSNLMLARCGLVKILDLGLAIRPHQPASDHEALDDRLVGTLDYMAPEQVDRSYEVDIRADIYSFGATLYRLLCGRPPFAGDEYAKPVKKMLAVLSQPPPPLRQLRPDVPGELAEIVARMVAKAPPDRFVTPADTAAALAPFTVGRNLAELVTRAEFDSDSPTQADATEQSTATSPPLSRTAHTATGGKNRG